MGRRKLDFNIRKQIKIDEETEKKVQALLQKGETFNGVVRHLLNLFILKRRGKENDNN